MARCFQFSRPAVHVPNDRARLESLSSEYGGRGARRVVDGNQNGVAEFYSAHMLQGSTLLKGPKVAPV
jgi:hypothetical protein